MKGQYMESLWRTVQQFISYQGTGIFEVEINLDSKDVRCNCPVYTKKGSCKHCMFVNSRIKDSGHYSIMIPDEVSEELAIEANESQQKFREFVVKYGKIEVL